ncbi:MAG TPA: D-alanyl-D-alanine carboxypeptidase/D-alanyl-D-alanine-endopeptidase [Gaiellaceae bacterium]|nr:D-alanyl-D-alanine carboxypeptidase/D-alanyl-D-alanine-endopeptidase [Gaiellaceae bacterium]
MNRPHAVLATLLVAVTAATSTASSTHAAQSDLASTLAAALHSPGIDPGRTGAIAVDLQTGATVFAHNPQTSLLPASAEKLPVSFAALKVLGPRYRFRTEVVGLGTRAGRVWKGNLWLVGFGDPTLARSDLDRLARTFAATGIRRVLGRVFGDDTHFDAQRDGLGWKPGYLGIESRPISALSVARVPLTGVHGSAVAAARAYVNALERRGISVSGRSGARRAPRGALSIAFDLSEPLSALLRRVNGESDNFVAEMLLKELGATIAERGSSASGARVVRKALRDASVPLAGVRIADGSGLSRFDRLTATALVSMLRAGAVDPAMRRAFVSSFAVAGVSGTLERRLDVRPTRGRVIAKTGTTRRASALAGFVGRRYVFAILQNGSPVPYWTARETQDRFVTILAGS